MIRIETLRTFVHVAECGNIRDAAERLCRTPSAISMTLKQLEQHLDAPLFETDRKNSLTALGKTVGTIATELLWDHDRAVERIEAAAAGRQGRLQLASVPSVAAELLPGILADFMQDRPGVTIDLVDTDSASVHAMVAGGEVELGIAGPPSPSEGLAFSPLFCDPLRLVCRADHPLASASGPIGWEGLRDERIISNEVASKTAAAGYRALSKAPALSARNVISLLALVRAGAGVTLLPKLATVTLGADLVALPLADATAVREVGVILRHSRSPTPVCMVFLERVTEQARTLARTLE